MKGQRILAIDHGSKRIGFALSDELGWTAQPLETFYRRNPEADIRHIQELVREHEVGQVLVGLPLRLDGESGPAAKVVQEFIQLLEPALSVPVVTWDERMTTCAAEDLLIAADVGRRKRKGIVDRIAAAILLQSYLASLEKPTSGQEQTLSHSQDGDPWSFDEPREDDAEEIDCGSGAGVGDTPGDFGVPRAALGSKSRRRRTS